MGCPYFSPIFPPEDSQADSSISPLPHLEAKIRQTHSLARLLTKYAEQLLQEYVSRDECGGAGGLGNAEVQIIRVLDHPFSQPHFPAVEIGAHQMDQLLAPGHTLEENHHCAPNALPSISAWRLPPWCFKTEAT